MVTVLHGTSGHCMVWHPSQQLFLSMDATRLDCPELVRQRPAWQIHGQIPIPEPITNPIIDPNSPISADGIDLFLPDRWFSLYAITGDSLWLGDADEFKDILVFRGRHFSVT